jgi:hypothetical protein
MEIERPPSGPENNTTLYGNTAEWKCNHHKMEMKTAQSGPENITKWYEHTTE